MFNRTNRALVASELSNKLVLVLAVVHNNKPAQILDSEALANHRVLISDLEQVKVRKLAQILASVTVKSRLAPILVSAQAKARKLEKIPVLASARSKPILIPASEQLLLLLLNPLANNKRLQNRTIFSEVKRNLKNNHQHLTNSKHIRRNHAITIQWASAILAKIAGSVTMGNQIWTKRRKNLVSSSRNTRKNTENTMMNTVTRSPRTCNRWRAWLKLKLIQTWRHRWRHS